MGGASHVIASHVTGHAARHPTRTLVAVEVAGVIVAAAVVAHGAHVAAGHAAGHAARMAARTLVAVGVAGVVIVAAAVVAHVALVVKIGVFFTDLGPKS